MKYARLVATAALIIATSGSIAFAHVTLETDQAPASGYYKAVLRVPHGCEGSPTVAIRVQIPEGVQHAKPMPKPGWKLDVKTTKLKQPYESEGTKITEDVSEISWTGGNLPDAYYDEFVFRAKLPNSAGQTLYFPVIQTCAKGETKWIEIPSAGQDSDSLENPAPGLKIGPATTNDD